MTYQVLSIGWTKDPVDANPPQKWHIDWDGPDVAAAVKAWAEMAFDQEEVAVDPTDWDDDVARGSGLEHRDPSGITWLVVSTDSPRYPL